MSILLVNERVEFNTMKELLGVTDGNLASHVKALEKASYLAVHKSFLGKKPNTKYSATKLGRAAFEKHLNALERLLNERKK